MADKSRVQKIQETVSEKIKRKIKKAGLTTLIATATLGATNAHAQNTVNQDDKVNDAKELVITDPAMIRYIQNLPSAKEVSHYFAQAEVDAFNAAYFDQTVADAQTVDELAKKIYQKTYDDLIKGDWTYRIAEYQAEKADSEYRLEGLAIRKSQYVEASQKDLLIEYAQGATERYNSKYNWVQQNVSEDGCVQFWKDIALNAYGDSRLDGIKKVRSYDKNEMEQLREKVGEWAKDNPKAYEKYVKATEKPELASYYMEAMATELKGETPPTYEEYKFKKLQTYYKDVQISSNNNFTNRLYSKDSRMLD